MLARVAILSGALLSASATGPDSAQLSVGFRATVAQPIAMTIESEFVGGERYVRVTIQERGELLTTGRFVGDHDDVWAEYAPEQQIAIRTGRNPHLPAYMAQRMAIYLKEAREQDAAMAAK